MKEQILNRAKLGAFVIIATVCLVAGLYYIGSKKNIFDSTITVSANFKNVGGLMSGNNVRFNGINVGTVTKIYPIADTLIKVEFTIKNESIKYITKNAIASIGTDGLLGNKLVNISPGLVAAPSAQEGDMLQTSNSIDMDKELRTITLTNDNLRAITANLLGISERLSDDNSVWSLLADTLIAENVRSAVVHFRLTGLNTAIVTGDLRKIVQDIKNGRGTVGALLTDTLFSQKLNQTIVNIQAISDSVALISGDFRSISQNIKNGNGAMGTLLTDTAFANNLNISMQNIKDGTGNFNEDMEALKLSWPFKKYFKKQAKAKAKADKENRK